MCILALYRFFSPLKGGHNPNSECHLSENLPSFHLKSTPVKDVWFGVKSLKHHYYHPNFKVHTPVEFEIEKGDDGRERALRVTGTKSFVIMEIRVYIVFLGGGRN